MQKEIKWLLKEKYFDKPNKNYYKDIERLKAGEPVDYVIGFTNFLGCKIDLSKKPLIPRPETEFWVNEAVLSIKDKVLGKKIRVLDIFAGSGCVGVSIVRHIEKAKVVFAEKDKRFLEQIKINVKLNKINSNRYKIIQSDVFSKVKGKFDYIFANPPYISTRKKHRIQKSVLLHEPSLALFGGSGGLFYIKKFLSQAKDFLTPKGIIFMEFDYIQKKQIETLIKKYGYQQWEFKRDQYKKWRWVIIQN